MQTRTYGDLFKLISALVGTGGQLATGEQDQLRHFINRRFQEAFDESPVWPRYLVSSEERQIIALTLSGATSSTSTSVNQDYKLLGSNTTGGTNVYQGTTTNTVIIYNTGSAWRVDTSASAAEQADGTYTVSAGTQQFIEADTNKKNNVKDVETWTPRSGSDVLSVVAKQLIPYAETNKTTIGDFNRIHRKKAFLNNSAIEYEFFVDFDGANILNVISTTDNTAFVSYKKQFTPFTLTSGYYDSSVEVPGEFFNYIAHSSYADFLRVQNKQEEAIAEEGMAKTYLALELEKIDIRSNNNTINKRFSTYVNRQSR
jgi:archaellum component FlaG (FlaF/FlaG flagellin family)